MWANGYIRLLPDLHSDRFYERCMAIPCCHVVCLKGDCRRAALWSTPVQCCHPGTQVCHTPSLQQMRGCVSQAEELQYFEALMLLCEQFGLPSCAREFATAALHAVDRAFPEGQEADEPDISMATASGDEDDMADDAVMRPESAATKRMQRRGRLWGQPLCLCA